MTNQEVDRKIAFIIEQQAQFTSNIQQLREAQSELQATQVQTDQVVARLAHVTLEGFKDVNAKIHSLVDSQIRTDENLRNLIAVVDRYFSEGRNGH
jgi:DNA-directed RNA polymerase subunit F